MNKQSCECKKYMQQSHTLSFYTVVYTEDAANTPLMCPVCNEKLQFRLPTHIPEGQLNDYASAIMQRLKAGVKYE